MCEPPRSITEYAVSAPGRQRVVASYYRQLRRRSQTGDRRLDEAPPEGVLQGVLAGADPAPRLQVGAPVTVVVCGGVLRLLVPDSKSPVVNVDVVVIVVVVE
jgi:hypothetical protein